jgi:hypothetical protein
MAGVGEEEREREGLWVRVCNSNGFSASEVIGLSIL